MRVNLCIPNIGLIHRSNSLQMSILPTFPVPSTVIARAGIPFVWKPKFTTDVNIKEKPTQIYSLSSV